MLSRLAALLFGERPRSVKFDGSESVREMNSALAQWKREGWTPPPAPKDRPVGNVVRLPFGGEYAENVQGKQ